MISLSFQAYQCLSGCEVVSHGCAKKLLRFIYWEFLEAKVCMKYKLLESDHTCYSSFNFSVMFCFFFYITGCGILLPWTSNRQRKRASLPCERGVLFPCSCRAPSRKQEGLFQLLLSSSCHQVCVLL